LDVFGCYFYETVCKKYSREDLLSTRSPWQIVMIFSAILIANILTSERLWEEVTVGIITS